MLTEKHLACGDC